MRVCLSLFLAFMAVSVLADETKPESAASPESAAASTAEAEAASATDSTHKITTGETMTIWIDVRTAEEFAQGHIPGSINIPYEIIGSQIASLTRNVDADIRVYCRSGRRSGVAMDTLHGMGYGNVINEGGYEDLLRRKAQGEAIP